VTTVTSSASSAADPIAILHQVLPPEMEVAPTLLAATEIHYNETFRRAQSAARGGVAGAQQGLIGVGGGVKRPYPSASGSGNSSHNGSPPRGPTDHTSSAAGGQGTASGTGSGAEGGGGGGSQRRKSGVYMLGMDSQSQESLKLQQHEGSAAATGTGGASGGAGMPEQAGGQPVGGTAEVRVTSALPATSLMVNYVNNVLTKYKANLPRQGAEVFFDQNFRPVTSTNSFTTAGVNFNNCSNNCRSTSPPTR
jgi:hypothetical protein